jgi:DNA-binding NarL/FixJ family response regulator
MDCDRIKNVAGQSNKPNRESKFAEESGPMSFTSPLAGLVDVLELLVAQARAYERALPPNNYPARVAVATLGELARQALNEARGLSNSLEAAQPASGSHPFSPREYEVLGLAAIGLTNKEIAYRLGISERTIQFHINSIFNKTSTNSRTEAVALALQKGWIRPFAD